VKRLIVVALAITGILAAGCIVRFSTLYEEDETSHYVGLASNLSTIDVVAASIQVDFYDRNNRLLDTKFVSPCTRTLQVNRDSPFEAIAPDGITANHVQTTVRPLTIGKKVVADLDVDNVVITESGDTIHIKGDIDVGRKDLFAVNVCAALLDKHGNVLKVGHHRASPSDIDRDDAGTFDVSIPSDDDATKYELWVDALVHNPNDVTAPVVVGPSSIKLATATPTQTQGPSATPTETPEPTATPVPSP
jgi:hypothetical protein